MSLPEPRWIQLPPKDPPPKDPPAPEYIEPGRYLLQVENVEEKVSASTISHTYFLLKCRVLWPPVPEKFRIYFALSLSPIALWRMREFLEAIWNEVIPDYGVVPGGQVHIDPSLWVNKRFYADIEVASYLDKRRNVVRNLYPERRSF